MTAYVMVSHSDDGNLTWSHEEKFPLRQYETRVRLFRQGSAHNRVYRLRCSDNVSFTLVSASAEISVAV